MGTLKDMLLGISHTASRALYNNNTGLYALQGLKGLSSAKENLNFYNNFAYKPFTDLSEDELEKWKEMWRSEGKNPDAVPFEQQVVWHRNRQFVNTFGKDAFNALVTNSPEILPHLGETFNDMLAVKVFENYYNKDDDFPNLQLLLSPEGKRKMLEEGVLNKEELKQTADLNVQKAYDSQKRLVDVVKKLLLEGGFTAGFAGQAVTPENTSLLGTTTIYDPKTGKEKTITRLEDAKAKEFNKQIAEKSKKIQDIITADADYKIDNSDTDALNMKGMWQTAMSQNLQMELPDGTKKDYDVYLMDLWDKVFKGDDKNKGKEKDLDDITEKPDSISQLPRDENGNPIFDFSKFEGTPTKEENFNGTNHYKRFKDEADLDNIPMEDKLTMLSLYLAVVLNYGEISALPAAETIMKNYIAGKVEFDNGVPTMHNAKQHLSRILKTGVEAQLMNFIMNLESYAVEAKYGKKGLYEWMNGRDASGDGTENSFLADPQYWQKVEQYNTYDTDEIKLSDKHGGLSPYNPIYSAKDELGVLTMKNFGEMMEMTKFVIALYLLAQATGGVGKAMRLPKGLTATLEVTNNAMPIAFSYSYGAYHEVMDRGKADLEKLIDADATKWAEEHSSLPSQSKDAKEGKGNNNFMIASDAQLKPYLEKGYDKNQAVQAIKNDYNTALKQEFLKEAGITFDEDGNIDDYGKYSEDFEHLKESANATFLSDNIIELLRYAGATATLRKYMLSPSSLQYLSRNTAEKLAAKGAEYNTETGAATLSKSAARWHKAKGIIVPVWSSGQSNYLDEVTTGLTVGFGLGDYNNYLARKYDPEGTVLGHHQISSDFLSGVLGAVSESNLKWFAKQSLIAFMLGAGGGAFGPMVNSKDARNKTKEYYGLSKWDAEKKEYVDTGKKAKWYEKVNTWLTLPVIASYQNAVSEVRAADDLLEDINKVMVKHKDDLDGIAELIMNYNRLADKDISTLESKDKKEAAVFSLINFLDIASQNEVMANNPLVLRAIQQISELATGNISQEMISSFLHENQEIKDGKTEEEQLLIARETILKNAERLQKMQLTFNEVKAKIESSKQLANKGEKEKIQILYNLVMDANWKERLALMETEISGNENVNTLRELAAEYSTQEGKDRMVKIAQENLEREKKELEELENKDKRLNHHFDSASSIKRKKTLRKAIQALALQIETKKETVKHFEDEVKFLENDGESGDLGQVLSALLILNLNPFQRSKMLDESAKRNYSELQRQEIDKARRLLKQKNPDLLKTVDDAAEINERIEMNQKALEKIYDNPEQYAEYVERISDRKFADLTRIYKDIRRSDVRDTFMALGKDPSGGDLTSLEHINRMKEYAKASVGTDKLSVSEFNTFVKEDAEELGIPIELHPLNDLRETFNTERILGVALDMLPNMTEEKRNVYIEAMQRLFADAESSAEVMSLLEDLIDLQSNSEAKDDFKMLAEVAEKLKLTRDATKIQKRKEDNVKKVKNDGSYWGWSGFHNGGRVHTDKGNGTIVEFKRDEKGKPVLMGIKYDNPWQNQLGETQDTEYVSSQDLQQKLRVRAGEIVAPKDNGNQKAATLTIDNEVINLENGTIDPLDDIEGVTSEDVETGENEAVDTSGWTVDYTSDVNEVNVDDIAPVDETPIENNDVESAEGETPIESTDVESQEGEEGISSDDVASTEEEVIDTSDVETPEENEVIDTSEIEGEKPVNKDAMVTSEITVDENGMAVTPTLSERDKGKEENVDSVDDSHEINEDNTSVETDNSRNPGLLAGNYYVEYHRHDLSGLKARQVRKKGRNERDLFSQYMAFNELLYKDKEGSIQDTVDNELADILKTGVRILFAMLPAGNAFASSTILNVVELTDKVKRIHGGEHGTVECGGKRYLVVGTLGFSMGTLALRSNYNQTKSILMNERQLFFSKTAPTSELSAYVSPTFKTTVASATNGYITHQLISDAETSKRSVAELADGKRGVRNPHGISLGNLKWGIQFNDEVKSNVPLERRYDPKDVDGNLGAAFIYIPTLNGMYIPIRIDPCRYSSLKEGSKLKQELDLLFHKLINPDYETRKAAITELVQRFYFGESENILIGTPDAPCITIIKNGVKSDPIWLNRGYDRSQIMKLLTELNPRINITEAIFLSPSLIRMYSEAGAMLTDAAKLATSGILYSVYQCDAQGNIIAVENTTWSLGKSNDTSGDFGRTQQKYTKSTIIEGKVYREIDGVLYDESYKPVTDAETKGHIQCSMYIRENQLTPDFTDAQYKYYIIKNDATNPIVWAEARDGKVYMASQEITNQLINERVKERMEQERRQNAEQELEKLKKQKEAAELQSGILEVEAIETEDIDLNQATSEEISLMNMFGVSPSSTNATETTSAEKEKEQAEKALKEEVKEKKSSNPNETGKIKLSDLDKSKKITTFAGIMKSSAYKDKLVEMAKEKGWIPKDGSISSLGKTFADKKAFLAEKGISLEFDDVEDFFNLLNECF